MNVPSSLRKTLVYPVFGALFLALIAGGQPLPALAGVSPAMGAIGGYADLLAALQAAGVTITQGGDINQSFIPVQGHAITVNGADVQVFEFQDDASRQEVSDAISQVQNSIDTALPSGIGQSNVWATGRLIVVYVGQDQATFNVLTKILGNAIILAPQAASPSVQPATAPAAPSSSAPSSPATSVARQRLAKALGVPADQVQLVSAEQAQWPNTCLGMTPPGKACADEVTPGWRMTFNVSGQQYEVRTNETASDVRWQAQSGPGASLTDLPGQATNIEKQLEKDVQQSGLPAEVTKLEKQLGISGPEITQTWNEFVTQANTILEELDRDVSQLSKNIQTSGASK
jgi:hypothetical protein